MLGKKEVLKIFEHPKDRSEHWLCYIFFIFLR